MRIGIDARTILNPDKGEAIGVGHYTYQLIRHLLKIDKENEYVLFFDFRVREKDVKKFTQANVKIKFYPYSDYKKYLPGAYSEMLGTATLQKEKLDVLHSTSHMSRIPSGYRGKTLVTFHSLAAFEASQYYPQIKRLKEVATARMMASKANKIIAVSQSLKFELGKSLHVPQEKVEVVYSGLDKRFFAQPSADAKKTIAKFGIDKKYILFLGTLEPSKNIPRLLDAFAQFKEKMKQDPENKTGYQLVIAGKKGWHSEELKTKIKALGLSKDVVFTGYVIGDELVPLFRNAEFFVMPSLYEGFGMTVLEAFATQTPAVISNVNSLPELAGDGAYMVNPNQTAEIAEAMWKMATNPELRESYRSKGLEQAKKFDWEETAKRTLEIYKSLV